MNRYFTSPVLSALKFHSYYRRALCHFLCASDSAIPNLSVNTIEDHFGIENVTVVLEWDKDEHITYNVTVIPHVPLLYINETVIQLTVPYNSFHFVSVVATLCDHNATNVTKLHYGELYIIILGKNHSYRLH